MNPSRLSPTVKAVHSGNPPNSGSTPHRSRCSMWQKRGVRPNVASREPYQGAKALDEEKVDESMICKRVAHPTTSPREGVDRQPNPTINSTDLIIPKATPFFFSFIFSSAPTLQAHLYAAHCKDRPVATTRILRNPLISPLRGPKVMSMCWPWPFVNLRGKMPHGTPISTP